MDLTQKSMQNKYVVMVKLKGFSVLQKIPLVQQCNWGHKNLNKKIHRYSLKEICKLTYTSKDFTTSIVNVVKIFFLLKEQ